MRAKRTSLPTLKRLFRELRPYKWALAAVLVCIITSAAVNVLGTMYIKIALDSYIEPLQGLKDPDLTPFFASLGIMAAIYLTGILCSFAYTRIMVYVTSGTLYNIRTKLFDHLQKLPIKYYDTHTHGELMSRFTNDTDTLREMISNALPQLLNSTVTVIGVVVAMLVLSPILTLLVFVIIAVMVIFVAKLGGVSGRYFVKQQKSLGDVNGYIEELIEGQKVVKVFCHEEKTKERFFEINDVLCSNATTANTCANILMPIMGNMSYIMYVLVALVGSILIMHPELSIAVTIGTVVAFLQYTRTVSQPITQISMQFNNVLLALAGAGRIFKILDEPEEVDEGYVTLVNIEKDGDEIRETDLRTGMWAWKHPHKADGTVTYTELKGKVTFDNVTFGYEPEKIVLDGITLYAHAGQKVAFVGSTGAGKTTITNLINRFYDVPDGKIRYDDININKIKKADLRRSLGMVLQDTNLFTGTVMDNIRYGKLDATDEECIAAARLANAHSFITRLPEGYQTMLTGNGANLSQGQRQLLSIARAAVADPPVLILDEATSSIDTRTEKLIEDGMDKLMQGRTVFVIAHRLSTVKNSSAIMVLEHGKIIERGTHEQLIEKKGKYYELYKGLAELS